jgi:hypothetical protein
MPKANLYHIYWTSLAEDFFVRELDFILLKWNNKEVMKFIDLVDDFIYKLSTGVITGKVSKKTLISSFLISKQTTIFFEVIEESRRINLLLFWNNKRDPKKLEKLLKPYK